MAAIRDGMEIGDFDTVWGQILFIIISGLLVYFIITHSGFITWLGPLAALTFPFIVCPLCDIAGKIIQDFIDKFK